MENVIKQGYLRKAFPTDRGLSGLFEKIDPNKWFVFLVRNRKPFLEYYDKDTDVFSSEPVNSFDLSTCQQVTYSFLRNARVHSFNIILNERVIDLASTSRELMISWVNTLENTLTQLGILSKQDNEHVYSFCPAVVNKGPRGEMDPRQEQEEEDSDEGAAVDYSEPDETLFGTFSELREKLAADKEEVVPKLPLDRKMSSVSNASEESDTSGDFVGKEFFEAHKLPKLRSGSNPSEKHLVRANRRTVHLGAGVSRAEASNCEKARDLHDLKEDVLDDGYSELAAWLAKDSSFGSARVNSISVSTKDSPYRQKIGETHIPNQGASADVLCKEKLVVDLSGASGDNTCVKSMAEECGSQNPHQRSSTGSENLYSAFPGSSETSAGEASNAVTGAVTVVPSLANPPPRTAISKPIPKKRTTVKSTAIGEEPAKPFQAWETFDSDPVGRDSSQTCVKPVNGFDVNGTSIPPLPPRFDSLPEWGSVSMNESDLRLNKERLVPRIPSPDIPAMSQSLVGSLTSEDSVPPLPPRIETRRNPSQRSASTSDIPPPLPARKSQSFRIQRPITSPPNFTGDLHGIQEQSQPDDRLVRRPDRQLSMRMRVDRGQGTHTVISLKHNQVDILRGEILSSGVAIEVAQKSCQGLALVDIKNKVWIAGWNWKDFPRLHSKFHVGDQLLSINGTPVVNAASGMKMLKHAAAPVEMVVLRIPNAKVYEIRRVAEGQSLGIKREGGTGEILYVDPNGLAANNGLPSKAECLLNPGFPCNWFFTEINSRPVSLFFKDLEITHRLNAVGLEISFVVQPSDFIFEMKKQLQKKIRNYKNYLPQ